MGKIIEFIKKHKIIISLTFFICYLTLFAMIFSCKDPDYYWHIKAGCYMVKNHTVLTHDIFSWYLNGKSWFSHEWLFEILIYNISRPFKDAHVFIYIFTCMLTLQLFIFYTNKNEYKKNIPFSILWIGFSLIFFSSLKARPHMLSNILLAITVYLLLDLYKNKNSKKIYFLPIIALIWANIHGGSSNLVYILPIIFIIAGLIEFKYSKIESNKISKIQLKKYILVTILSIIAICINPQGVKLLLYPYSNILDTTMLNSISEWQPTVLSNIAHYPYFVLLGVCVITVIFSHKKIRLIDAVLFLFVMALGLKSVRFWNYTHIIMSYIVFYYVPKKKINKGTCLGLFVFGILLCFLFMKSYNPTKNNIMTINDKAINLIKEEKPKRLYNSYNYGGYLINQDIKVFVDGRADLYGKYNYKDYLNISNLKKDYVKIIKKYDFDYFLVNKDYPIATYLKYNKDYEKIYSDKKVVIYKQK